MRPGMRQQARTTLSLELSATHASLLADTAGPVLPAPGDDARRRGYGLIGMRERAAALGGEASAGPVAGGWRVSCRVPLRSADKETSDPLQWRGGATRSGS